MPWYEPNKFARYIYQFLYCCFNIIGKPIIPDRKLTRQVHWACSQLKTESQNNTQ